MATRPHVVAAILGFVMASTIAIGDDAGTSKQYKALEYPLPASQGTWAILDFDGARRRVEPYLSSLGLEEFGTGAVVSAAFTVAVDKITFTICGHDGQGGGQERNFIALVDDASNETLRKTFAPGSDPMQQRSWEVKEFQGRRVRIEVHDGIAAGAFAWLGIGMIDAGPAMKIDFSHQGLPKDWKVPPPPEDKRTELVQGGVPFLRRAGVYTMIPKQGVLEIPCGFVADRLFFLGCTVARGRPLETYGFIEITHQDAPAERYPLTFGFTLDGEAKLPSPSRAMHVHASGDQFQYYLVIAPRPQRIETIRLQRNPEHDVVPRITAITCQTQATADNLAALPDCRPGPEEEAWIRSHTISTISSRSPDMDAIVAEIRRAHKME